MKPSNYIQSAPFLTLLLCLPLQAVAFGWVNSAQETLFTFLGTGRISAPVDDIDNEGKANGHSLATRRGIRYAIEKIQTENQKVVLEDILGSSVRDLDTENGFVMQNIIWGNFRSEIHTQLSDFLSGYIRLEKQIDEVLPKATGSSNPLETTAKVTLEDVIVSLESEVTKLHDEKVDSHSSTHKLNQVLGKLEKLKLLRNAKKQVKQQWRALAFVLADHEGIFSHEPFVDGSGESFPISKYTDLKAKYGFHTSTGYIHSMLVDGGEVPLTHEQTLVKIRSYAIDMMESVLTKLVSTKKSDRPLPSSPPPPIEIIERRKMVIQETIKALSLPHTEYILEAFENAGYAGLHTMPSEKDFSGSGQQSFVRYENRSSRWQNEKFGSALKDLGGLFHLIQDSTVGCTEKTRKLTEALVAQKGDHEFSVCEEGDGHSVFGLDSNKVIALSSGDEYYRRTKQHSTLDDLYQLENLYSIQDLVNENFSDSSKLYGSFDPAIATGQLLLDVVQVANELSLSNSNETDLKAQAIQLVDKHILSRYELK